MKNNLPPPTCKLSNRFNLPLPRVKNSICYAFFALFVTMFVACQKTDVLIEEPLSSTMNVELIKQQFYAHDVQSKTGTRNTILDLESDPMWSNGLYRIADTIEALNVETKLVDTYFEYVRQFDSTSCQSSEVRAHKKLVAYKSKSMAEPMLFALTLVPTPECDRDYPNFGSEFIHGGSRGNFSGFAFYSLLDGTPHLAQKFEDGKMIFSDSFTERQRSVTRSSVCSCGVVHVEPIIVTGNRPGGGGGGGGSELPLGGSGGGGNGSGSSISPTADCLSMDYSGVGAGGNPGLPTSRALTQKIVDQIFSLLNTLINLDFTAFLSGDGTTVSETKWCSTMVDGISIKIRMISISGGFPNNSICLISMTPTGVTYPSFPEGLGITLKFVSPDENAWMSITMLRSEYAKLPERLRTF